MTCSCRRHLSPFHWDSYPRQSIFLQDPAFARAASSGRTPSQIATEAVDAVAIRTGRSSGSIFGLSDAADKRAEYGIATGRAVRLAVYRKEA